MDNSFACTNAGDAYKEPSLVSIGVPVRNGEAYLTEALELLLNQTYKNIEVIVSDNNSSDGTARIIEDFAALDDRIRVFRHKETLSAFDNFQFVLEQSKGQFFMWAACDDRRSLNYIETLILPLIENPEAGLAFGQVGVTADLTRGMKVTPVQFDCESKKTDNSLSIIYKYGVINCYHIYGVIRKKMMNDYKWTDIDNGPDRALLLHLALKGDVVQVSGTQLIYFSPEMEKTLEEQAVANNLRALRPFPEVRLALECAITVYRVNKTVLKPLAFLISFLLIYWGRHWRWIKPWLFEHTPSIVVNLYRRFKHDRA